MEWMCFCASFGSIEEVLLQEKRCMMPRALDDTSHGVRNPQGMAMMWYLYWVALS